MFRRNVLLTAAILAICLTVTGQSAVPLLINLQGILKDAAGNPVPSGTYQIRFRIYDQAVTGNVLWESFDQDDQYVPVPVASEGLYNHLLGSTNQLPDTLAKYDSLWLGVRIGPGEPEMQPRTMLVSVMYSVRAFVAASAIRADTAAHSLDRTTDASTLITGTLDTTRYSAYMDLVSEGRIGNQPGQLEPGGQPQVGSHLFGSTGTGVSISGTNTFADAANSVVLDLPAPAAVLLMFTGNMSWSPTVQEYNVSSSFNVDDGAQIIGNIGFQPFPWTNQSSSVPASGTALTGVLPAGHHTFRMRVSVGGGPFYGTVGGTLTVVTLH